MGQGGSSVNRSSIVWEMCRVALIPASGGNGRVVGGTLMVVLSGSVASTGKCRASYMSFCVDLA